MMEVGAVVFRKRPLKDTGELERIIVKSFLVENFRDEKEYVWNLKKRGQVNDDGKKKKGIDEIGFGTEGSGLFQGAGT